MICLGNMCVDTLHKGDYDDDNDDDNNNNKENDTVEHKWLCLLHIREIFLHVSAEEAHVK